jgi:hypothetical protein
MEPLQRRIKTKGDVMNFAKPFAPSATETSRVENNPRELARVGAVFNQLGDGDSEMSVASLGNLLCRVSGNSSREIDTLIGELQMLREKLETDSRRLQNDISEYASLSERVKQLTKIISDSVRKLPDAQEPGA